MTKENYELYWKDYYEILQVHIAAEAEVIKVAYLKLVQKYNTDQHKSKSDQKWKDLNEAFEILGNPDKKLKYDVKYTKKAPGISSGPIHSPPSRPIPIVRPPIIRIINAMPGETKNSAFVLSNQGGPFSKIRLSKPNSWIKIPRLNSLSATGKLPLEISLELTGDEWGKSYSDNIIVKLDNEETHVRIEFNTISEDRKKKPSANSTKTRRSSPAPKTKNTPFTPNPPGPVITTLTPTLCWNSVPGADYYSIWVERWINNAWDIVYGPRFIFGDSVILPDGILVAGGQYFWVAAACGKGLMSSSVSRVLYFQT
jgi:curved DNA-binding protein CbpA